MTNEPLSPYGAVRAFAVDIWDRGGEGTFAHFPTYSGAIESARKFCRANGIPIDDEEDGEASDEEEGNG